MERETEEPRGTIKDKDLENLAVVRHEKIGYLVAYNSDYEGAKVKEYMIPKDFVKIFGLKPYQSACSKGFSL